MISPLRSLWTVLLLLLLGVSGRGQNSGVLVQQVGGAGTGTITYSQQTTLDTDITPMPIECQSFVIQPGVTLTVRGSRPLVVKASSFIKIFGTLNASGGNGSSISAGEPGPGSGRGGFGPEAGFGPSGGGAGDATHGGGGGGHATAGGIGGFSGCPFAAGGDALLGSTFVSNAGAGSGGGGAGSVGSPAGGGGGGGVVRLHANTRIDIFGTLRVNGGVGGTANGIAAGSGAGGYVELVAPIVAQMGIVIASGGAPAAFPATPCANGGAGGSGWVAFYADDLPNGSFAVGQTQLFDFGMVIDDVCGSMRFQVGPASTDIFNPGPACYVLFALNLLPGGQGLSLGPAGTLFLNPNDPFFALNSPLQQLTSGQGSLAGPLSFGVIDLDVTPLVPAIQGAGVNQLRVSVQGLQIGPGGLATISPVQRFHYLSVDF